MSNEVSPAKAGNTITELFTEDPLNLTREDFTAIIEHYRKNRLNFNAAARTTSTPAQAKKAQALDERAKQLGINLDDIEV